MSEASPRRGGLAGINVYAVRCFRKQLILWCVSAHKSIGFVIGGGSAFLLRLFLYDLTFRRKRGFGREAFPFGTGQRAGVIQNVG